MSTKDSKTSSKSWTILTESINLPPHMVEGIAASQPYTQLVFIDRTRILGVVLFEGYTGVNGAVSMHAHGDAPGWLRPGMVKVALRYAFGFLDVRQIICEVSSANLAANDYSKRLGGRHIYTIEGYFPDADLHVYSIERDKSPVWRRIRRSMANGKTESAQSPTLGRAA